MAMETKPLPAGQAATALARALQAALTDPALEADLANCPIAVTLVVTGYAGADATRLSLAARDGRAGTVECQADAATWARFLASCPDVGFQSFGALRRQPAIFQVVGEDRHWAQALPMLERLADMLRRRRGNGLDQGSGDGLGQGNRDRNRNGNGTGLTSKPGARHLAALPHLSGRYVALRDSPDTWAYSEEAGQTSGPALLMLHTAGADGRQWHGLMAQEDLRRDWRLLAFDLPGHGRSPLPAGQPNWLWQLDQQQYLDWVLRYLDAQRLDRVALIGCSMGAAIGLPLLARHPDRFAGAILLETPWRSPGRRSPWLNHAQVHGARLAAAWVGALLSPSSAPAQRDHATWIYSQGAPGIYDGDLAFYSDQFDASVHTAAIDTGRTPLWLLTGDYDYSATPADSRRVAEAIPGARFLEMSGFGHFPMVEDPDGLMPYLSGPLATLRGRLLTPGGPDR